MAKNISKRKIKKFPSKHELKLWFAQIFFVFFLKIFCQNSFDSGCGQNIFSTEFFNLWNVQCFCITLYVCGHMPQNCLAHPTRTHIHTHHTWRVCDAKWTVITFTRTRLLGEGEHGFLWGASCLSLSLLFSLWLVEKVCHTHREKELRRHGPSTLSQRPHCTMLPLFIIKIPLLLP